MAEMATANIIGSVIFGGIGFVAFIYGKKMSGLKPMVIGLSLMIFPYFVSNTVWMYTIGALLTAALFLFRD